jgi:hypothetical protein
MKSRHVVEMAMLGFHPSLRVRALTEGNGDRLHAAFPRVAYTKPFVARDYSPPEQTGIFRHTIHRVCSIRPGIVRRPYETRCIRRLCSAI